MITGISLSLLIVFLPILIVFCAVKAVKHTIIIRKTKKKDAIPTALVASLMQSNCPDRRYGLRD